MSRAKKCDRCQLRRINGIIIHEKGCPNDPITEEDERKLDDKLRANK